MTAKKMILKQINFLEEQFSDFKEMSESVVLQDFDYSMIRKQLQNNIDFMAVVNSVLKEKSDELEKKIIQDDPMISEAEQDIENIDRAFPED